MSFSAFNLHGARSVRVTRYRLGGSSRAEVLDCTIEVEYDEGVVEYSVVLEPATMNIAAFQALIAALNARLAKN